ncbi:Fc receptor-like protein 5 [Acipenser ruthenus]|uniref:Fc receptor-like protein 5 n=1 Tax=Acipenser ruthenus TaxID=7906 RepID=UPI002741C6BE|nr:Fc receptor-like protein 5 [Acipenser ruthenus]
MRAGKLYIVMLLTTVACFGQETGLPATTTPTPPPTTGKPKPVLTREPAGEIFEGDTVTLSCGVEGGSDGWRYLWYKDRQHSTPVYQTNSSSGTGAGYTISAAALSHSGEYWCGAGRGSNPFNSDYSNAVKIQVSELPQTTLTLEPPFPEICTGETVTLRCGVEGGSAGWKYLWYKDSEDTPVPQTAVRSITGDSYTITAAAVSDQGQYCCRGQRGDQPLYSQLSDKVILTVSEVCPKAVLTLQPAGAQIFTGETVTLSCEVEGGSAGWRFKQYRDGHEKALCTDQYSGRNGDHCKITYAQESHSGVYWCESASGQERSNAVNLTVSNEWVILQTPTQPVFEGDALTLKCRVRYNDHITRVVFYKDNKELQSQADTELSVARVSKSDEGSYKCTAWGWSSYHYGDSAEVRVSVRERPQAVLTQEPAWTQIYESERITLRCQVPGRYTDWRFTWYKAGRNAPVTQDYYSSTDGDSYTISSAAQYHSGEYTCKGERSGNPSYSKTSDALTLRVSAGKPKPVLTREPAGEIFEGDTVTLSCVVQGGSGGWRYLWYKDRQGAPVYQTDSSSGTGVGYTISAAALSQSTGGEYRCLAGRGSKPFNSDYSNAVKIKVSELFSTPTLTVTPHASVWEGEAVTLQCGAHINKQGTQLQYRYIKDNGDQRGAGSQDQYSIPAAGLRDTGSYQCEVEAAGTGLKKRSDSVSLTVRELFRKPILTFTPVSPVWEGEAVTLQCGAQINKQGTQLQYRYIKDNGDLRGAGSQDQHSILAAELRDTGIYQCEVEAAGTGLKKRSDSVRLSLKVLPQTTLTLEPPFPEIFTGETVTLRCGVEGGSAGWKYLWYKDSEDTPVPQTAVRSITGDSYTITAAAVSDQGQYCCRGQRGDQPLYSQRSDPVKLNITAGKPKPVLTREPAGEIFEGDTVTLSCVVEGGSDGWRYLWYKDSQRTSVYQTDSSSKTGARYTISAAALNHSGEYRCLARRGRNTFYSEYSSAVKIQVSELFSTPTLTVTPHASVWEGEAVTLQCGAHINKQGTQLQYRYITVNGDQRGAGSQDQYSIPAAELRDTGSYQCEVEAAGTGLKKRSDSVSLTVRELFITPTLTFTPVSPVWKGEAVTLQCGAQINKQGTQLQYSYIKDNGDLSGARSRDQHSIPAAGLRDTGSYQCEVEAAGTGVKKRSDSVRLSLKELPQTTLTLKPSLPEIFTGETVTLRCGVEGGSAGWKYLWYKDSEDTPVLQTAGRSITGDSYTITAAAVSDQGQYWCRGQRGDQPLYSQRSDPVKLNITDQWVILQTPLQAVIEGDTLTLRCRVRTNYTFTRIVFFKDNEEIQSPNNTELSVDRVSKSDEGSYKCRAMWNSSTYSGDSAEVRVSVRELFSRVTLTASPGATVKEGEALNLTCEAAVNKTPRPQLHYTIVRDGEPVTNSTDSALYSIASTEKSHTGSYTCAVESQGVKKSSQELHIEVQTSWHSAVAIGYRVSFTLIHFIVFTLLLLQYCRIQGSLCIAGGTSRKTSDQDQEQSAEGTELCSHVQHTGVSY